MGTWIFKLNEPGLNANDAASYLNDLELTSLLMHISVQSLSRVRVRLFATPWTAALQASLSSPTPRAYPNSCPLSQWCPPAISSSVSPSPSSFNLSQHQGFFQWVSSSHQVAKVLELQLQHQSFQWIFRTDFLWDWLVGFPCSLSDCQESSPTAQFKSINS